MANTVALTPQRLNRHLRATTREVFDRLRGSASRCIDHSVCAKAFCICQLVVSDIDCNNARTQRLTKQQGRDTNASATEGHQPLAALYLNPTNQCLPCCRHPALQCPSDCRREIIRESRQVRIRMRYRNEFGKSPITCKTRPNLIWACGLEALSAFRALSAREDEGCNHPVPDPPPLNLVANCSHLAAVFMARCHR